MSIFRQVWTLLLSFPHYNQFILLMEELVNKIKEQMTVFIENADQQVEKNNKAAGTRARKASLDLEKMLKEFRKISVEAGEKNLLFAKSKAAIKVMRTFMAALFTLYMGFFSEIFVFPLFHLNTKIKEGNKTTTSQPNGFLRESPPFRSYSLEKGCLIYSPSVSGRLSVAKEKNIQEDRLCRTVI